MTEPDRSRPRRRRRLQESAPPELIQTPERLAEIAERLAAQEIIAFDTEFLREKTFYPQLGLVQLADRDEAWLVDPLALTPEQMRPLLETLQAPGVLKVAHAAEQDQECLFHSYGMLAAPLLDTSIAAALVGRGDQVGLAPLARKVLGVDLPKGHTRTNWLARPLQPAMAEYAAADVLHLIDLAERLLADLDLRGRRPWALRLSAELADPARYEVDGEAVALKLGAGGRLNKREYAVLKQLANWREARVRRMNVPRRWLADDHALVQLARARPRKIEELRAFRGLGSRVRDVGAPHIIAAIERGLAVPEDQLEDAPRKDEPTPAEAVALAILKCFLNQMAQEMDLPLRYLMDNDAALKLLRGEFADLEELRRSKILSGAAVELIGEEVLAALNGRRGLSLRGGKAQRFTLPDPTAR